MPTLFAVYNLKNDQGNADYDDYLTKTKIPGIRGAPWCTAFNTWKIDKVLAPAVSEPEGALPTESPYQYVAKIEVSDLEENQINLARDHALEQKVSNVRFEVGDIYKLPFPDNTFDAAFAHTVLQHLVDPVEAAIEIHRVLKPDGIFGVREEDTAGFIISPFTPKFEELMELYVRTWKHNGGDPYFARRQRAVLNEAGFVRVEASASAESYGTPESTRKMGEMMADYMSTHLETAIQLNWVDAATVETLTAEWRSWGEHPDAFFGVLFCEAVGWVK